MPERKLTLTLVVFTFIFATSMFAQSARSARAGDECLNKPNAPAPEGQHWYYRIDHQNNRQCWRLGPEGLPVQKSEPQGQKLKPQAAAQPEAPPRRAQRPVTTGMASASADTSSDTTVDAKTAVAWPDVRSLNLPPSPLPVQQPPPVESTQSVSAINSAPPMRGSVLASAGDPLPPESDDVKEPQSPAAAPVAPVAAARIAAETDHAFSLLIVLLVFLVIAGPVIHFAERRRQRAARKLQLRRAPVVASITPAPSVPIPLAPDSEIGRKVVPLPLRSPDQSERLAQALQQLLDRLQADLGLEQNAMHSTRRPENGMTRSAR
jgi:hypothetical protein